MGIFLALLLRRQRERQGLTLAEAAERLGQSSRNAYARYEQGKAMPTLEKLEQLLQAVAPDQRIVWRFVSPGEIDRGHVGDVVRKLRELRERTRKRQGTIASLRSQGRRR